MYMGDVNLDGGYHGIIEISVSSTLLPSGSTSEIGS